MELTQTISDRVSKYNFKFYKKHIYNKKTEVQIETSDRISLSIKESERHLDCLCYTFTSENFVQKGVKDTLVFSPISWLYNLSLKIIGIIRDDLKPIFKAYRDKYRNPNNLTAFSTLENLYFNTPLGLEYDAFSNAPYLLFFIDLYTTPTKVGTTLKGLDWLLMPMSIPVNTNFHCTGIDDKFIELEGWITLDEERLEEMIVQQDFKEMARTYHYSKDFTIDSLFKVQVHKNSLQLHSASFNLEIKGEKGQLHEKMTYEVKELTKQEGTATITGRYRIVG